MLDPDNVKELKIDIDASFHWSVGGHMETFIKGLADRKLWGSRCPNCKRVMVPPRKICDRCFCETSEFLEVGPAGTVMSFTVGHVEVNRKDGGLEEVEEPEVYALIKPDGADTSFVHRLVGAEPELVSTSMKVTAVWSESPDGDLSDLRYFEPV